MAAIPLHCNICPKKPNFSDVSHLLTHIASKGHLSNYYKVKVRASQEDASRRLVEAYDRWYSDWNVEDLMSERMNQKDKRRTRARPAARSNPPPPPPPPEIQAPAPRPGRSRTALSNMLDPRLSEQQAIKVEHSVTPTPTPQPGPVLRQRTFAARMQYWPAGSRSTSHSHTNPDYETSSEYSEPSIRKPRYRYAPEDSCAVEDDPADAPAPSTEDPMAVSESTKLKGVFWPGMDLFDSATPEMRRKRNQKKDSSVVERLEFNSTEVEATELIFTPQGSFKKQRRISSSVYEDEEESSPIVRNDSPKHFIARPAVLSDVDPNTTRRARPAMQPPPFYPTRGRYENDHGRSNHGHRDYPPRKKRNFEVFNDDEVSFNHPAPFNLLTAGYHRHQASPSPAPNFLPHKAYADFYPFENKENSMSAYQQQPAFEYHHRQPAGYYHAYAYGLNHEPTAFQYENSMYLNNAYHHHPHDVADDQRTVSAPPSPSTG